MLNQIIYLGKMSGEVRGSRSFELMDNVMLDVIKINFNFIFYRIKHKFYWMNRIQTQT